MELIVSLFLMLAMMIAVTVGAKGCDDAAAARRLAQENSCFQNTKDKICYWQIREKK